MWGELLMLYIIFNNRNCEALELNTAALWLDYLARMDELESPVSIAFKLSIHVFM